MGEDITGALRAAIWAESEDNVSAEILRQFGDPCEGLEAGRHKLLALALAVTLDIREDLREPPQMEALKGAVRMANEVRKWRKAEARDKAEKEAKTRTIRKARKAKRRSVRKARAKAR